MEENLDRALLERFRTKPSEFDEQLFLNAARQRIEAVQARRQRVRRAAAILVMIAAIALSPWLIEASLALSDGLEQIFDAANELLDSKAGMIAVALLSMPLVFLNRKKIF